MSYQLVKYQNSEGGPFTPSNNRCHVDVNLTDTTINMSKSHFLLEVDLTNENNINYTGELKLGDNTSNEKSRYTTACLIRTATLETEKKGIMEENKYINVLSQTMATHKNSGEDWEGGAYFGKGSCWVQNNRTVLKVPMEDIYGMGNMSQYPAPQLGNTTFKLEFENVKNSYDLFYEPITMDEHDVEPIICEDMAVGQVLETEDTFENVGTVNNLFRVGDTLNIGYTPAGGGAVELISRPIVGRVLNAPAAPATTGTVTFTLGGDPLPVGTDVECGIDGNSVAFEDIPVNANAYVLGDVGVTMERATYNNEILKNKPYNIKVKVANNYQVEPITVTSVTIEKGATPADPELIRVKFTGTINIPANVVVSQISMTTASLGLIDSWSITKVYAVIARNNQATGPAPTMYKTYTVEMTNNDATTDYRKQFHLENNTMASYIFPVTKSLLGVKNGIEAYRQTLNNEDITNRDVIYAQSLYDDVLMRNMPELKSLNHYNGTFNVFNAPLLYNDESDKVLNFHATGNMDAGLVYCFKTVMKPI